MIRAANSDRQIAKLHDQEMIYAVIKHLKSVALSHNALFLITLMCRCHAVYCFRLLATIYRQKGAKFEL